MRATRSRRRRGGGRRANEGHGWLGSYSFIGARLISVVLLAEHERGGVGWKAYARGVGEERMALGVYRVRCRRRLECWRIAHGTVCAGAEGDWVQHWVDDIMLGR